MKKTTVHLLVGNDFTGSVQSKQALSSTSVWMEHVTDRRGVVIYRATKVVNGPRKDRYVSKESPGKSTISIAGYVFVSLLLACRRSN